MMARMIVALFTLLVLFPLRSISQEQQSAYILSTPEDFKEAFTAVPCKNEERLPAVKALFLKMGAPEADISI